MKTLLFNFTPGAKDAAIREASKLFGRAGAQVVTTEVDAGTQRKAGVTYRVVHFTFADGQQVDMAFKETGDVFEVRVNGKVTPLRQQDDHVSAIAEIADRLDKGRSAFQRALAKVKVPLPPSIRVSRTAMLAAKIQRRDDLNDAVTLARARLAEVGATPAA